MKEKQNKRWIKQLDKVGIFWIGILILCISFCVQTVQADVIWEPMDSFYESHRDECEYINRSFTANGPDGKVIVYESPVSSRIVARVKNDTVMFVSFSYKDKDGTEWAVYEDGDTNETGWMPMDYLTVVYDTISFEEEYSEKIDHAISGELDSAILDHTVYFWDYPGSTGCCEVTVAEYVPEYSSSFTDEEGRQWVQVNYYMGIKKAWICLDAPDADFAALYPQGAPKRGEDPEEVQIEKTDSPKVIVPDNSGVKATLILASAIVVLVVIVTAILLIVLKKNKKKS